MPRTFDGACVESPLEEMSVQSMAMVERLGVCAVQMLNPRREIRFPSLHDQVVVIGHKAVSKAKPASSTGNRFEPLQEPLTVLRILKNRLAPVAACRDVVNAMRNKSA